jgi:16S rRNA (guanine(1405)-N(7))-methyltransferase
MVADDIVALVIDKKELRGVSKKLAARLTEEWLTRNEDVRETYHQNPERFTRRTEYEKLRSEVREQLRKIYGVFFTHRYASKKEKYVKKLIETGDEQARQDLLNLHRSSKERLTQYPFLYSQLFDISGTPTSVLDLGCGFNPFAYQYLGCTPEYHTADIACDDAQLIDSYLESLGIQHSSHCIDLSNAEAVKQLPAVDIAFAFKLFDSLEDLNYGIAQEMLNTIPADILIASFPTKSIGQHKTLRPRKWFEEIIADKLLGEVTLANEQFYVITLSGK